MNGGHTPGYSLPSPLFVKSLKDADDRLSITDAIGRAILIQQGDAAAEAYSAERRARAVAPELCNAVRLLLGVIHSAAPVYDEHPDCVYARSILKATTPEGGK